MHIMKDYGRVLGGGGNFQLETDLGAEEEEYGCHHY